MITENAPPLFLFYLDDTLSSEEEKELKELMGKAEMSSEDKARIELLSDKYKDLSKTTPIPVPIMGSLVNMIPDGFEHSVVKNMDIVGSTAVLKGSLNSAKIAIKCSSGTFINTIIGLASWLFAKEDSSYRVSFFSPELVVIGGTLINATVLTKADTTEKIVALEIQKNDSGQFKTNKKDPPKQLAPKSATEVFS